MAFEGTLQEFTLLMYGPQISNPCVEVQQADAASRMVRFHLKTFAGADYIIPYSATAIICINKTDGNKVYDSCKIEDRSTVLVTLTKQAIACSGKQKAQLYICTDEGDIKSQAFYINVPRAVYSDDAIESKDEFGILKELIANNQNIQESAKASEEAAKAAMQAAQDAAAGVAADREQIAANKEGIAALKKTRSSAIVQTASGTAIVVPDSADDPVRGLRVFGRTIQDGTPTPDAPIPLVSAGGDGSIEVGVFGKNLLNVKDLILDTNTSLSVSDDGYEITATGFKAHAHSHLNIDLDLFRGKTLHFMADLIENTTDAKGRAQLFYTIADGTMTYMTLFPDLLTWSFLIPEDTVSLSLNILSNNTGSELETDNTVTVKGLRLCYEEGAEWTPYVASQSITFQTPNSLPGIPVTDESLATYTDSNGQMWCADEVDFERGVYVQRIWKGSPLKTIVFNNQDDIGRCSMYIKPFGVEFMEGRAPSMSSIAKWSSWGLGDKTFALSSTGLYYNDSTKTLEEVNALFAELGTNFEVAGILATPIETPLTESELAVYQSLRSNYPVTTVLNDANAHMEFNYNADPKNYIAAEHAKMEAAFDAKLAEIIALLPAETQAAMIDNETTNLLNESEE